MIYRDLGRTGLKISGLSFGCMRFPDAETAAATVRRAVELGVNYFDTSCDYCRGESETWLGEGLKGLRDKVLVSTKSPPGEEGLLTADEVRRSIDKSLQKLQTDYLDFYQAWRVNDPERYAACVRKGGWLDGVRRAMDEGLVRHLGLTSHSTPPHIISMLDDDIFEVMMVQYSIVLPGYRQAVRHARERGVGVIVMGPLGGGLLAQPSPLLEKVLAPDDPVTGAFRYVLADPGVSSIASGMTAVEEVESNCRRLDELPKDLSREYQEQVNRRINAQVHAELGRLEDVFCAGCRYCITACPNDLRVFDVFKPYNMVFFDAEVKNPARIAAQAAKLSEQCDACRACEEVCPQQLEIPEHLERVRDYFAARGE